MEFFDALTGFEKVLWFIAIPTSLVFLIQFMMIFLGLDSDGDLDTDTDFDADVDNAQGDAGASFGWFSFKNLMNFFVMFSWTGIACINQDVGLGYTTLWATLAGLSMVVMMTMLMYGMKKLAVDRSPKLIHSVGKTGTVTLAVQEGGKGKANVLNGGAIREVDVISDTGFIPRGATVEVTDIRGHLMVVKQK